jgi:hypothetical protein
MNTDTCGRGQPRSVLACWDAFKKGISTPSLLALGVAGLVCATAMGGSFLYFTEDRLASSAVHYIASSPVDDYAFSSYKALRLRRSPVSGTQLALIGTAAAREAMTEEADIANRLEAALGQRIPVHDLLSGGLSAIEMTAYAESLGPNFEGVIVVGMSFSRLAAAADEMKTLIEQPRLGYVSAAADEETRASGFPVPLRTGIYLVDNYKFYVARYGTMLRNVFVTGPVPKHITRTYLGRPATDEVQWAADAARLKARLANYEARAQDNLASVARMLKQLPNNSRVKVVLLEIPLNPRALDEVVGRDFIDAHHRRLAKFAADNGVEYWDLNEAANLTPSDFQDWSHINSAKAQQRFTGVLVDRLLPLLGQSLPHAISMRSGS